MDRLKVWVLCVPSKTFANRDVCTERPGMGSQRVLEGTHTSRIANNLAKNDLSPNVRKER